MKTHLFKRGRGYRNIKTEKVLEQDQDSILATKLCCYVEVVF